MPRKLPDDPEPWKVLSSEYLSRKPWFTVRVDRVSLPTGAVIPEYWVSEYLPWVNVVAVTREGKVSWCGNTATGGAATSSSRRAPATPATVAGTRRGASPVGDRVRRVCVVL